MDLSPIGSRIKAARENKKITQEELAALLDMSTTHISVIERGVKTPKLETFIRIANVLGVSADYLLMDIIENPADVVAGELSKSISKLSQKEKEKALTIIRVMCEE
uniref:helix-turn-helix domain-containing protein n=1 Tax=Agathobacter sp. TaxID=2021311 RepID=UPI004056B1E4